MTTNPPNFGPPTDPGRGTSERQGSSIAGKAVLLLVAAGCFAGIYAVVHHWHEKADPTQVTPAADSASDVSLGVAYGSEKKAWFEWAAAEFARSPEGHGINLKLQSVGSIEGAQQIVRGDDKARGVNVWCPASSLYKSRFASDYKLKYADDPIASEASLAATPMVFVFWDERYHLFLQKYHEASFKTIGQALQEGGGWQEIAGKPDWGQFRFAHTHPNKSNSGLMALCLMAYDFYGKTDHLTQQDVLGADFRKFMDTVESAARFDTDSTGDLMHNMINYGYSEYDCICVYESVAIDFMPYAETHWGKLRVEYPRYNVWSDNPCYVLNVPWSTPRQREAAEAFKKFMLSLPAQTEALKHGFRPADLQVPVRNADSPFVRYEPYGLKPDLNTACQYPEPDVLSTLIEGWERRHGGR